MDYEILLWSLWKLDKWVPFHTLLVKKGGESVQGLSKEH
jgi:hypothetical protein